MATITELCVRQLNGSRELIVVDLEQTVDALKSRLVANQQQYARQSERSGLVNLSLIK